ncbi:MAG: hypothetical protein ABIQ61_02745 [Ornithinibacter sp.]
MPDGDIHATGAAPTAARGDIAHHVRITDRVTIMAIDHRADVYRKS